MLRTMHWLVNIVLKRKRMAEREKKGWGGDSFSSLAGGLYIESLPCGHCGLRMTDWKAGIIKRGG